MARPLLTNSDWLLLEAEYEESQGRLESRDKWLERAVKAEAEERKIYGSQTRI